MQVHPHELYCTSQVINIDNFGICQQNCTLLLKQFTLPTHLEGKI